MREFATKKEFFNILKTLTKRLTDMKLYLSTMKTRKQFCKNWHFLE